MYTLFSALLSNDQNTRVNGSGGWEHKTGSDQWLPLHSQSYWEKSIIPQILLFCFFLLPQKTYEKEIRLKFMRQEPWSAQCRQKGGKQDSPLGLVTMNQRTTGHRQLMFTGISWTKLPFGKQIPWKCPLL